MSRPDAQAEVIRRNNVAARLQPKSIIFAGLDDRTCAQFSTHFPASTTHRISSAAQLQSMASRRPKEVLRWGSSRIGIGLLLALRAKQTIQFSGKDSDTRLVRSESGHLVVCEEGDEFAQVIAANFAYSLGAGLCITPEVGDEESERILERFYSLYDTPGNSPTSLLEDLQQTLRQHGATLPIESHSSVTFITNGLPWGFAYPQVPSTHLFSYPDLGSSVLHGLLAEQPRSHGIRVALVLDPGKVEAREIRMAVKSLAARAVFVKGLASRAATVYAASRMIEMFPYDFLLISTHCGDAPGYRWTYEFEDREGHQRTLVVDIAVGAATVPGDEKLDVMQFIRLVSLDGVDWNDPEKQSKVHVGYAIRDFFERLKAKSEFEPVRKQTVDRVAGSAALKMFDGNFLAVPRSLANNGTPVVLNNACTSWHRLASNFMFGDARAYIGTLIPVSDVEAEEVASRLLDRHFGSPLEVALWRAQNEVYGDGSVRRPYVLVGTPFQRLRTTALNAPVFIANRLRQARQSWLRQLQKAGPAEDGNVRRIRDYVRFLSGEIQGIEERWLRPRKK